MASKPPRPDLWVDVALALALITLATILLNGAVIWLVGSRAEAERRTELSVAVARSLRAQLELKDAAWRPVVGSFSQSGLPVTELWVVDPTLGDPIVALGEPPRVPDAGLREALHGRNEHLQEHEGVVQVTEPLVRGGRVVGALRVGMPVSPGVPAGVGLVVAYTVLTGGLVALFGWDQLRRRVVRPVQELGIATQRIAGGEFGEPVELDAPRELQELAQALTVLSVSLASYRDRTARQLDELEAANDGLRRAQEELIRSEKLASVGRLAAGVAHEVGNPLAAVIGYLELLQAGVDDPEVVRRALAEVERINRIIRELLDYARPGAGIVAEVVVGEALESAAATVRHLPAFREVRLEVKSQDLPVVRMDPDKLHQALVNLLLNAADAAPGGRVELLAEQGEGRLRVICRDDGPGFADIGRIFEPFYTTKEPGKGTGLGLATVQRVVEAQGGRVRASNRVEGGAEVVLELPWTAGT